MFVKLNFLCISIAIINIIITPCRAAVCEMSNDKDTTCGNIAGSCTDVGYCVYSEEDGCVLLDKEAGGCGDVGITGGVIDDDNPPAALSCKTCPNGYFNGCNTCTCDTEGLAACDDAFCVQTGDSHCLGDTEGGGGEEEEEDGENDISCATCDNKGYFDGCNECTCGDDGVEMCTLMFCEKKKTAYCHVADNEEEEDGDSDYNCDTCSYGYFDGCNNCECGNDGGTKCTEKFCVTTEKPKCLEEISVADVSCGTCDSGEYFDGCNRCKCDEDGNLASCTKKYCEEDKPSYCFTASAPRPTPRPTKWSKPFPSPVKSPVKSSSSNKKDLLKENFNSGEIDEGWDVQENKKNTVQIKGQKNYLRIKKKSAITSEKIDTSGYDEIKLKYERRVYKDNAYLLVEWSNNGGKKWMTLEEIYNNKEKKKEWKKKTRYLDGASDDVLIKFSGHYAEIDNIKVQGTN